MMENIEIYEKAFKDYLPQSDTLEVFKYPSPVLKKIATAVENFDQDLKDLIFKMLNTMYQAPGIGLAAPQVGVSKRLFVMDINYDREKITKADGTSDYILKNLKPLIFINPIIKDKEGEILYQEGCLSVPGIYEDVKRFESISISFQDWDGNHHTGEAKDLLSVCIQHENDHLDGVIFLERLSLLKKNLLTKKYLKKKKKKS